MVSVDGILCRGVGSLLVLSGYEWSSGVFDCLAIRYGCVWVLTPLYVLGGLFSVWFSRWFWVLFGTVLLLVCYCSA